MQHSKSLLSHVYVAADRLMLGILWVMFALALGISTVKGSFTIAFLVGAPGVLIGTAVVMIAPGRWVTRVVIAALTMVFAALHIHQLAGQTEIHFGIFVLLAFLLCYRDWTVIVAAAAVIAVHHASFNALQQIGIQALCLTEPSWGIVVLHAAYVVAEAAVLCYLSVLLRREALQAAELTRIVHGFASGDSKLNLRQAQAPAVSNAGQALQGGMRTLDNAIATVANGVERMRDVIAHIAEASSASAAHTDAQVGTLRHATQETQLLTDTVNENRDNAGAANELAASAAAVAQRGGAVVMGVVDTMNRLNNSSAEIVHIIDTIDGIAFQTNILALNAAVEAARAGEQGRGFAVVAAEVRNLAQRSAAASREIKTMIEASVSEIENGHRLAGDAGNTMAEIVKGITEVHGIMGNIADASRLQAEKIGALHTMLDSMQAAAAGTSELACGTTDAAKQLQGDADSLSKAVDQFQTT